MTFSLQVSSLLHIAENRELDPKVYSVPEEIDRQVAAKKLASLGLSIDSLTREQAEYMASWKV
jgi:adenosylhomocysteinase